MKTILVIDDDPLVRRTIQRILQKRGYGVQLAADGLQGLRTFRSKLPDLIITDIVMPPPDGLETIRALRASSATTKIIAISGGNRASRGDLLAAALALGASAAILKPFAPEELLSTVNENLSAAEMRAGLGP
ncbi:MAG TPA: response regulator [Stellaceae bacterium]|nr:response regulator [Stellaceae bacterium]